MMIKKYSCSKCHKNLYDLGRQHAYQNKINKKMFCKDCAKSKRSTDKVPNPKTFDRIKKPKISKNIRIVK